MNQKENLYNYWRKTKAGEIITDCKILNDTELAFSIPNNEKRRLGIPLMRIPNCSNKSLFKKKIKKLIILTLENYAEVIDK